VEGRTDKTLFRSAALLVVVAATIYGLYHHLFSSIDWTPLRMPVVLEEVRAFRGEFIAQWGVVYEIQLDTDRNLDLQVQNCLLGIETLVPERCAAVPPDLILSRQVRSDGEAIAGGGSEYSQTGYWGPSMGKILGAFQASEGHSYRIDVNVGRSSPRLQLFNPRLQVTVAQRERKWTYVWSGLLIELAAGILLLAIALIAILAGRAFARRRR
jgi:hypothetical protein